MTDLKAKKHSDWIAKAAEEIVLYPYPEERVAAVIASHCPFKPNTGYVKVVPDKPGHISDWAARAAEYIAQSERKSSVSRLAAVIEYFAKPLIDALKAS